MFPFLVYSPSKLSGYLWQADIYGRTVPLQAVPQDAFRLGSAMTRQVNQPSANRRDAVPEGRRSGGHWRVRVLEGVIISLLGLNVYLVYSVATSSAFPTSTDRSAESIIDPSAFQIQVEVLNGCGERGIGQRAMRFLRERGFDVVNIGNADHFEYRESVVLDRRGTDGPSEAARAVGNALGTPYVLLQRNDDRMVDVSVVIGKDYGELAFSVEND